MRTALPVAITLVMTLGTTSVFAQDNPPANAGGDANGTVTSTTTVATPKAVSTTTTTTPAADDGVSDHEKVVGKFGVGYMGLTQIPIGGGAANGVTAGTLNAPVIGMRYWFGEKMGIDVGLGFGMLGGSREVEQNNVTTTVDAPAAFGLALHGGVPLVFAHSKHYKFLAIPELNVAFARRVEQFTGATPPPDIVHSGFRLDIGARIGSEIHFGFIGVPQLALQATVGLMFTHQSVSNSQDAGPGAGATPTSSSISGNAIGTTVQSDPWAIFANNISAIYYFP